jgi:hypothetical protein
VTIDRKRVHRAVVSAWRAQQKGESLDQKLKRVSNAAVDAVLTQIAEDAPPGGGVCSAAMEAMEELHPGIFA